MYIIFFYIVQGLLNFHYNVVGIFISLFFLNTIFLKESRSTSAPWGTKEKDANPKEVISPQCAMVEMRLVLLYLYKGN